jgi:hypothetical protein
MKKNNIVNIGDRFSTSLFTTNKTKSKNRRENKIKITKITSEEQVFFLFLVRLLLERPQRPCVHIDEVEAELEEEISF